MKKDIIGIYGARVHNLKNITVEIPNNQLVVITGLSGSGKSSLAFDTLFAEGQRRYVESLSAYARQFLGRINKPEVDKITGISPAIAIEQKVASRNPRSTVGTSTEIYDYLKLMFARVGRTYSPVTGEEVRSFRTQDVVEIVCSMDLRTRVIIASPLKYTDSDLIERITILIQDGFDRLYVDGEIRYITEILPEIEFYKGKKLYIVVDRVGVDSGEEFLSRVSDSVDTAMKLGEEECVLIIKVINGRDVIRNFTARFEFDGVVFEKPSEHLFSFNSPVGACFKCEGSGKIVGIDEDLVVPDKGKSLFGDGIACWKGDTMKWWKEQVVNSVQRSHFPIHRPYYQLSEQEKQILWRGCEHFQGIDQFFQSLEKERYKIQYRVLISRYTGKRICPECNGGRLKKEATYVKVAGLRITDMVKMPADKLLDFLKNISLSDSERGIADRIVKEITNRLGYLHDVGLGYISLDRLSSTLSGGESQRINLATSLGSSLVGSMYILDEPSIGLHPRDTHLLINVLKGLRDIGNTVIVVEHDEEIMRAADTIIDIGPKAGEYGGEVVFVGDHNMLEKAKNSLTADYLTGREKILLPKSPKRWKNYLLIKGARENNLKNIDVKIPLGVMTCVTGVSGSGKSSLVKGILYPALHRHFTQTGIVLADFDSLEGDLKQLNGVEFVDQNPIGKSSRSNPVTYIKAYDEIRKIFAEQQYAKINNFTPSHFSFNIAGGRCEECQGEGVVRVGMQFMADIDMLCEACLGRRFKDDILEVRYREKSIDQILDMSVEAAIEFFSEDNGLSLSKRVVDKLKTLRDVGLGYVKLGQPSSTLSGGESQRVKLASYLLKDSSTSSPKIFIFDEPTTGLHFHDVKKLLKSLSYLIDNGNTVVVVEHNMDMIKSADWVIDLGKEGGEEGGNLLFEGIPSDLMSCEDSYTGKFLVKNKEGVDYQ